MSIVHYPRSPEEQKASRVVSSPIVVAGDMVYMTVIPKTPIDGSRSAGEQASEIFAEIEARLAKVGSNKSRIAHVTIWLAHLLDFEEVTARWNAWVDKEHPPARACAQVGMANPKLKVEMIVVAHL